MRIEPGLVKQPYGKDDVVMNFMVSPFGKWIFGPTDVDHLDVIRANAHVFNYVKFKAKNPKYYVRGIDQNFKIKSVPERFRPKLTHDTTDSKNIFFFLFYEPREGFVAMNYTVHESEFDIVDKKMNILSVVAFYGRNFEIQEERWEQGITVGDKQINIIVEKLKNESKIS